MQAFGSGQVEEGLIEGQRFDGGGEGFHHGPDRAGSLDVGGEAGFYDHGGGAEFQGLKHRHRGPHAGNAGDVAAGGNDPPGAAADDHGVIT